MAIYIARWDCPTCGTIGNRGPETRCANCGTSRPADIMFYLPRDEEAVEDARQKQAALAGVDWRCGHCESQNKATQGTCNYCGNPRDALSEDVDLATRTYRKGEVPTSTPQGPSSEEIYTRESQRHQASRFRKLRPIVWAGVIGLILIILSGFIPITLDVEVTGFTWERSVQMEHYEPVAYEDWSTPTGAYDVRSFRAIHHYDKVFSHTETRYRDVRVQVGSEQYVCGKVDMGNGYFQDRYCSRPVYTTKTEPYRYDVYRDVPAYRTKYAYKVMEWVAKPAYIIRAKADNHQAQWPTPPSSFQSEEWRQGKQDGNYLVTVDAGESQTEPVPFRYWMELQLGQEIPGKKAWLYGSWYGLEVAGE